MQNEELLLQLVKEIHNDQKTLVDKVNTLTMEQAQIKSDLTAGRNGYEPHEVVNMLHWIDKKIIDETTRTDTIKKAIISWAVPILCSALLFGLVMMYK